jgi:glycine hydroxymethyltransferase
VVTNAKALAEGLGERGLPAVSGGTDNHLFLLSLVGRDISGKKAQNVLDRAAITVNKNLVPFDPRKAMVTSGVRIGSPAVTSRGMREPEMAEIVDFIARVLERPDDEGLLATVRAEVEVLCRRFPHYPARWSDRD